MKKITLQLILTLAISTGAETRSFGGERTVSFSQARKIMPSIAEIMTLIWGSEAQSMNIIGRAEAGIFSVKYGGTDQVFKIDPTIYYVSPFLFKGSL